MLKWLRKYHKWFSLAATFFILFFAASGIILNHRGLLSGFDVSRRLLPPVYRYDNWNLAAVRGAIDYRENRLVFGNIGVWQADSAFTRFTDFNRGFPAGIDNRRISSLAVTPAGDLFAGTLFGLYRYGDGRWNLTGLPVDKPRVVKVLATGDSLLVMTRSELFLARESSGYREFSEIRLPAAEDDDGKTGLFRTLWVIHSGEVYGLAGKLIVDTVGIVMIVLCITGLIYFIVPYRLKRLKDDLCRSRLKRFNRSSLKWHNVLGSWAIAVLLLNTATGMFLRPPLLIPIASERVGKIPLTELDSPNPWFDRLRDLQYDPGLKRFLVATGEGIYYSDDRFRSRLKPFSVQPPVSVMGINVFDVCGPGLYRVGSFSGIFEWEPSAGRVTDRVTRLPYLDDGSAGPPFGSVTVTGYIATSDTSGVVFDYARGAFALNGKNPFPQVPGEIIAASPVSLWSTALEIHTGRIFEPVLGPFYILVVPLVGLATLIILISGFLSWWLARRKKTVS